MGKVYNYGLMITTQLQQAIPNLSEEHLKEVSVLWAARWEQLHTPLHAAGFALDPEFRGHAALRDAEVTEGLQHVIEIMLPETKDAIAALSQHASYMSGLGVWGPEITQQAASTMAGHAWWLKFGTSSKELSYVAQRVLAQVSSACACERNWSAYDFVHSERRNRLVPERAEKLVYVFSNLRLAARAGAVDGGDAKFMPWGSPMMDEVPVAVVVPAENYEEDAADGWDSDGEQLWESEGEGDDGYEGAEGAAPDDKEYVPGPMDSYTPGFSE
jgi:hAT family C-terminal dimerisation region